MRVGGTKQKSLDLHQRPQTSVILTKVLLFTDGSCLQNPGGPGGWAAIVRCGEHERELFGCEPSSTNNRQEMLAVIMGLEYLTRPCDVAVFSDSRYVTDGIYGWVRRAKLNGWRRGKNPIPNLDLWKRLDLACERHTVHFHWVRGHDGHPENERCDVLAGIAARQQIAK